MENLDFNPDDADDGDPLRQHEALDQLDEWRAEAREAVEKDPAAHAIRRMDELPEAIKQELLRAHRVDIEELLEKLKDDKAQLDAQMESDRLNEVRPTQADLDKLQALTDAIDDLEDLLNN